MSYQPPKSPTSAPAQSPFNPAWLLAGLVASSIAGVGSLLLVPQFSQVWASFDAELPALTACLQAYPWAPCLLPVAVLAVWAAAPRARRDRWACAFGVFAGMAAIALMLVALYLPIFVLASKV
ncbi:hypothetical protein [Lysobacter enzymogenes]|uniref:hypothetical protein n=1 Tax=Lysobacter enzymogenes TaxID=69 RepID=UPI001AF03991|nr:hypothetical protein [Lysobacter enzymogenes]QQQ03284.1 hypothetical protein JHW41_10145 [Lysobacter enzymogenes]